jgi:threonine/homoserine/homoserine lactone efflux protein
MDVFLTAGVVLGLSAGFSPGPLTTLVLSHALQHGMKEGLKVCLAPFITDAPIIALSVYAMSKLRDLHTPLGVISLVGALFLGYLAYSSFRAKELDMSTRPVEPRSLGKGTLVNFLSPNPYLFWLTVGGPQVVEAWTQNVWSAVGFLLAFYACLVGGKFSLAVIAAKSRAVLTGSAYKWVMRVFGALLLIFSLTLVRDGVYLLVG